MNYIDDWSSMLTHFTKSSCLVGSLYLPNGERIIGPVSGGGFGKYLLDSKNFEENRVCHLFESEKVRKACLLQNFKDHKFKKSLTVKLLPIRIKNEVVAVIIYGWIFEHFPDPQACNKIAKALGIGEMLFWQAAWLQTGTSHEKLIAFEAMLELLSATLVKQLTYQYQVNLHSHFNEELLVVVPQELMTPLVNSLSKKMR